MTYKPRYASAIELAVYHSDNYKAVLLGDIISIDIDYEYLLIVTDKVNDNFIVAVSAENSDALQAIRELGMEDILDPADYDSTCFLCLFENGRHSNLGGDKDWTSLENFKEEALFQIESRLGEQFKLI